MAAPALPDAKDPRVVAAFRVRCTLRDRLAREPDQNEMREALIRARVDQRFVDAYFPHRPEYEKES